MSDHDENLRPVDDPKLTAYALGELDVAASRAMRERIAGDDEANAYVREVRAAAGVLSGALRASGGASDADVARLTLRRAERSLHVDAPARGPRPRRLPLALAAAAACVAIGVTVAMTFAPARGVDRGVGADGGASPPVVERVRVESAHDPLDEVPFDLPNPVFAGTPKVVPDDVNIDRKQLGKSRGAFVLPRSIVATLSNVAVGKDVTSSDDFPILGDLELVTDGDKEALDGRMVELAPGKQWVQIDLGRRTEVFAILVWHNHIDPRVYRDVIVQIADDAEFSKGVVTVFNNDHDDSSGMGKGEAFEYFESFEGKMIDCTTAGRQGTVGRYVRLYSKGSTADDANHYGEVEVWGREMSERREAEDEVRLQAEREDREVAAPAETERRRPTELPIELPNPAFIGTPKDAPPGVRLDPALSDESEPSPGG